MSVVLNRQIFRVNNSQAQIASLALHQGQHRNQQVDTLSSIMSAIAPDTMDSISYLIYMFYTIETNVFLMLGLSPATAFRMFPPLEQFPEGSVGNFALFMQYSSLAALLFCALAEVFPVQHMDENDPGLLTALFQQVVGNNPALNSLLRFIRTWLFMASLHVLCFEFVEARDLLLFLAKARALCELL
ncbi:hypothetical protein TRIATDRAFT_319102 [Trichoderma atroviride IMI 206040]|uniref:Uncharacterized protein n=1 Tax=Hypocrea atroviridis (strain ATCC 20476 / IMI 206040) TaxID=452589 RepID=G9NYX7_HYPAI|nr:uncharacterized protein TRIATDRAFT_319102 [Trichoderma atroviride IMI 206040]EHK43747.1 hypothetical protein TRIATDRAFT_319102 [Trichoderma atroviride IMI 206040]